MNALLTGSHVYGKPKANSDIDLVIRVDPVTKERLEAFSEISDPENGTITIRFGRLNIIACDNDAAFAAWTFGTEELKKTSEHGRNPISKQKAKSVFDKIRDCLGVQDDYILGQKAVSDNVQTPIVILLE